MNIIVKKDDKKYLIITEKNEIHLSEIKKTKTHGFIEYKDIFHHNLNSSNIHELIQYGESAGFTLIEKIDSVPIWK